MIHRFSEITGSRKVSGVCTRCGKRRSRTFRITHTINPFNKNADGSVRTRDEVAACVREELAALVATPFLCATCTGAKP